MGCDFALTKCLARYTNISCSMETSTARNKERIRSNQRRCIPTEHENLFEQTEVRNETLKFHSNIAAIDAPKCSICLEQFPGMKLHSFTSQCIHCHRDKHIPKLYSTMEGLNFLQQFEKMFAPVVASLLTTGPVV